MTMFTTLPDGVTVREDAIALLARLRAEGRRVSYRQSQLFVSGEISKALREEIRPLRFHLMHLSAAT